MKNADEILVTVYAHTYGWLIAAVRNGERDGAAEVAESYRDTGSIPYHVEHGSRREREAILRELSNAGLLLVSGNTQARRCGLTWPGVCRATALTVEAEEIGKAFDRMREIEGWAVHAGGELISPSGSTPEFLLAPELGFWWRDCTPDKREVFTLARARLFDELLPALVMRWLTVAADCHGRRWYTLTAPGRDAMKNPPAIPPGLPKDTLTDFYLAESDRAWEAACRAKPRDTNAVHIGVSASRWWIVRQTAPAALAAGDPPRA